MSTSDIQILRLTPTPPFDFPMMLQRPLSRPSKLVVVDTDNFSYTRVSRVIERLVPITVVPTGTVEHPELTLSFPGGLTASEETTLVSQVRHMFNTDLDLAGFYEKMSPDPAWTELMIRLRGLRPIQDVDLFESMVRVIIGQQLNIQFAATLVERLIEFGAAWVEWNGASLPVFPAAEQVAGWSYDDLRALSFSQRKAEYVIDFARAVIDGKVDLAALWEMPNDNIYECLIPLRGIGRWTVECFLLFGLGRPDLMPAADIGVQNAIFRLYALPERPGESEIRQMAEKWAPWRSYATYYLWQSLIDVRR